jgi:signal transduction histidine kinase
MKLFVFALANVVLLSSAFAADVCSKKATEDKVNEVCADITKKGAAIKSEWPQGLLVKNCGDNYVWVQDTSADIKMVMHPIKQRLNDTVIGKQLDENKVALFAAFDKEAKAKAAGAWVDYVWAKPGAEKATPKTSFVKICKMASGESWIAGSGVWKEDIK